MPLMKLRKLGENSSGDVAGVTIPRDDLRLEELMDENGELLDSPQLELRRIDDGEWKLRRLDE